jgi:uncharacterized membrane protein (DUF106 family)
MSDGKKIKDPGHAKAGKPSPVKTSEKKQKTGVKKKRDIGSTIMYIVMILGFGISFGSVLLPPSFRDTLALIVNFVVGPLSDRVPFYLIVMIFAIVVTVFSTVLQKYTMNWDLIKRVNQKVTALTKERREAQIAGDKERLKKLDQEQLSLADDQMAMTKEQFKPMGFIVFVSIPLFWWMYWFLVTKQPNMMMTFPFFGTIKLLDTGLLFPNWIWWSILCSFTISYIIRKALNVGM